MLDKRYKKKLIAVLMMNAFDIRLEAVSPAFLTFAAMPGSK
jgi:hypothetical protein